MLKKRRKKLKFKERILLIVFRITYKGVKNYYHIDKLMIKHLKLC
jgi:hypothetical protein